jgi:aminopeptidase
MGEATMSDPRIEKWADVLTGYCVDVQPGQTVAISGGVAAEPLLRAIYAKVMERGGYPVLSPDFSGLGAILIGSGNDDQLGFITPFEQFDRTQADCSIRVMAETNTRNASGVDPARSAAFAKARSEVRKIGMQRSGRGEYRWSLTLFPTDAYAQDAEMSTDDYSDFIMGACKLNEDDPVAAWVAMRDFQTGIVDWLTPRRELRLIAPGTDFRCEIAGRKWINSDGKRNFPSGEVFTGPVEDSAQGEVRFSFPVVTQGREISDIRLRFENGTVVDASAAKNEDFLIKNLDSDEGARQLGEIAVGTNFGITKFTGQILLDEKIGGTAHMALGAGYPETGSTNTSAIHWDMICDLRQGGRIEVDGEPLLVDGKFVI